MIEMIEHMEEVLNRELTPKEKRFVEWLSGWPETIDTLNALLDAFYKAGQADTLEQQQREIDARGRLAEEAINELNECKSEIARLRSLYEKEREISENLSEENLRIVNWANDTIYSQGNEIERLREALGRIANYCHLGESLHTSLTRCIKIAAAALSPKEEEETDVQDDR